jgi:lactoylglutathione lyase
VGWRRLNPRDDRRGNNAGREAILFEADRARPRAYAALLRADARLCTGGFFDTPDFLEAILSQPGADFQMMLLQYKDGRDISEALRHGPTGFFTDQIEAVHARLVAEGAVDKGGVIVVEGGIKVALLDDPEGHEIELCQMP